MRSRGCIGAMMAIACALGASDALAARSGRDGADPATTACVSAERAFSRALGGSCQIPLGAYATLAAETLHLRGFLATPDGRRMVQGAISGAPAEAEALGRALAARLCAEGGEAILAELACQPGGA